MTEIREVGYGQVQVGRFMAASRFVVPLCHLVPVSGSSELARDGDCHRMDVCNNSNLGTYS